MLATLSLKSKRRFVHPFNAQSRVLLQNGHCIVERRQFLIAPAIWQRPFPSLFLPCRPSGPNPLS
jgi:hypothetical protein